MTTTHVSSGAEKIGIVAYVFAGIGALVGSIIGLLAIWHHLKNYRRPDLQRSSIRILLLVPLFALSSFISLSSKSWSDYIDTIRDIYEGFVVYSFFTLLINYLGGEREILELLTQRLRVQHLWPFNLCFRPMNMSDPDTFIFIKRGVLQFILAKPLLAVIILILKLTDNYKESYIAVDSSYMWLSLFYNISVCWSFYCLVLFYFQCKKDLAPYRPLPKFLSVKSIIFLTFWQGTLIAFAVFAGWIHDQGTYSANNISMAISDFLLCLEMPLFALGHWFAFPWTDYDDDRLSSRMVLRYAISDVMGVTDIFYDSYYTFVYQRPAVSLDDILYGPPGCIGRTITSNRTSIASSLNWRRSMSSSILNGDTIYGVDEQSREGREVIRFLDPEEDAEMEQDYRNARALIFGDYNFPVVREDGGAYSHPPSISSRIISGAAQFNDYVFAGGDGQHRDNNIVAPLISADARDRMNSQASLSTRTSNLLSGALHPSIPSEL